MNQEEIDARIKHVINAMDSDGCAPDLHACFQLLRGELPVIATSVPPETLSTLFGLAAALMKLLVASIGFDARTAEGKPGMSLHRAANALGTSEAELIAFAEQEEARTGEKLLLTGGEYLN